MGRFRPAAFETSVRENQGRDQVGRGERSPPRIRVFRCPGWFVPVSRTLTAKTAAADRGPPDLAEAGSRVSPLSTASLRPFVPARRERRTTVPGGERRRREGPRSNRFHRFSRPMRSQDARARGRGGKTSDPRDLVQSRASEEEGNCRRTGRGTARPAQA